MEKINWRNMVLAIAITLFIVGSLIAFAYYSITWFAVAVMSSAMVACVWSTYKILEDGED